MSAYLLTFAAFAGASGRASDIYGLRRVFVAGTLLLAAASIAAGMAQSGAVLIGARAVQGLAAALVFPAAFAISTTAFPPAERGTALGVLAAIGTSMLAAGPLVGGILTTYLSWRYVFYVNVPLAAVAMLVALALVPRAAPKGAVSFDLAGLLTLSGGIGLVVLALMQGDDWGWTGPLIPGLLAGGALLVVLFTLVERRNPEPLVDVRLFAIPTVSAAALVFFTMQLTKIVVVVFVPLYLQHRLGLSPVVSGLIAAAAVIGSPLVSLPAGKSADRYGSRRPILLGTLATGLSALGLTAAVHLGSEPALIAVLLVWGFALPYAFLPSATAVMRALPQERQGEASGITVTSRLLGGVVGMAGASAILAAGNRYDLVFLAMALVILAVYVVSLLALTHDAPAPDAAR